MKAVKGFIQTQIDDKNMFIQTQMDNIEAVKETNKNIKTDTLENKIDELQKDLLNFLFPKIYDILYTEINDCGKSEQITNVAHEINDFLIEVYDIDDFKHDMKKAIKQIRQGKNPKIYPTEADY